MHSNPFYQKLLEKQQQKAHLLYSQTNKENQHQQPKIRPQKQKRPKTQSILIAHHQSRSQWYLDTRQISNQQQSRSKMVNNWMCLHKGMVEFAKLMSQEQFPTQIEKLLEESTQKIESFAKSIVVEIWTAQQTPSLVDIFIEYALALLSLGKGNWSLAAFTLHHCYDLLCLDCQGILLSKERPSLSRAQLFKEQLMRRVFGFAGEKEKDLGPHQLMAKWQLTTDTVVYFIVRNVSCSKVQSNALMNIQKENIMTNRPTAINLSILRPTLELLESQEKFVDVLKDLGLKVRREDELSRPEREAFLKRLIAQLQGELVGKQLQLDLYKSSESPYVEEELGIPSQRLMMGEEHFERLKRQIKGSKIL